VTIDTIAPDTSATAKRRVVTRHKRARVRFSFSSNEPGVSVRCSLDGRAFSSSTSPKIYRLRRGRHTLAVRARDLAGNVDTTPASRTVRVVRKRRR
jgi:hypothetical protein